jgi:formylmethanofuran dehydrogenase subunit E
MPDLSSLYHQVSQMHAHLCPRQVLGVRMGTRAGLELGLTLPQAGKRLIVLVETDGCTVDGVGVATGCWVGRRTMFIFDYGKVAATFVDSQTGQSIRIMPHPEARSNAFRHVPNAQDQWHCQLLAYQTMPDDELLAVRPVQLNFDLAALISDPGLRCVCRSCGEEISNGREVGRERGDLCRSCAGDSYYLPLGTAGLVVQPDQLFPRPALVIDRRP